MLAAYIQEAIGRAQLQEVLEDWITLGLRLGHPLPTVDGISKEERRGVQGTSARHKGGGQAARRASQ